MSKGRMLTSDQVKSIRCSLTAGMRPKEVARIHGVTVGVVYSVKAGRITADQPGRRSLARRQEVMRLRARGMTYQAIADGLGISKQRVHQLINNERCSNYYHQRKRREEFVAACRSGEYDKAQDEAEEAECPS